MAKMKISCKMHIFIILSTIFIALGLASGIVFQFISNGYFNYSNEYSDYNCVVVDYAYVDLSAFGDQDGVKKICDDKFDIVGVQYVAYEYGNTSGGGELKFKFLTSASTTDIKAATEKINAELNAPSKLSSAVFQEVKTEVFGGNVYIYGSIAVASAIVLQCLYFAIRYKLTMAFATLVAHLHNIAIYVSFVALTRLPIGSEVFSFGILTVLATILGTCCFFGKMRRNIKNESLTKYDLHEQTDICLSESFAPISISSLIMFGAVMVTFGLLSFNIIDLFATLSNAALAVIAIISFYYGTVFFTPAVYTGMRRVGENFKASHLTVKDSKKIANEEKKVKESKEDKIDKPDKE